MGETQLIRYHGNSGPVRCPGSWSQLYTDCETLGKALRLFGPFTDDGAGLVPSRSHGVCVLHCAVFLCGV